MTAADIIDFARVRFDPIDVQLDKIEADIADLKGRVTALELAVAQLHGDFTRQSLSIDRIEDRLDRIERRLGPAETHPQ
jgi:predicted  nucleic acid-binding Zn-ribbon protein